MKPSFADFKRPPLVDMIIVETPTQFVTNVHNAIYDGADAFGFQMERLKPEFRTEETLTKMFSHLGDRPLYITNYRGAYNHEMTEEARLDELKLALRCGASLIDITGDTFDPVPGELTKNPAAIEKQKKFIEEVHEMGGQVLMFRTSSDFCLRRRCWRSRSSSRAAARTSSNLSPGRTPRRS